MIVKQSDPTDLANIGTEDELDKHISPHVVKFYETNKILLHLINITCWLILLKIIW
jgi:hypothetical protein